ncbi:hypothetical protein [Paeniglutamicibacter kerguelensis]|uniref:Uncharacterized protein n=1 Tax=Paeniglutamicibacter kerguelensis TaxID=254788 RepID=A0ABS4XCR9_9MICC|nr:hypothetical protein [Paeniglutamicibacter kerguelensis]MBP2386260.1 hypothetical protein [Paeniglutamicibacter kerguelensis]
MLVTEEKSIDHRTLSKISMTIEGHLGVSEAFISRVTQTEWDSAESDFVRYLKNASDLGPLRAYDLLKNAVGDANQLRLSVGDRENRARVPDGRNSIAPQIKREDCWVPDC